VAGFPKYLGGAAERELSFCAQFARTRVVNNDGFPAG
jgi:hypothetical protein